MFELTSMTKTVLSAAGEDIQVVDIKLAVLGCEGGIEMMRHGDIPFLP